MSAAMSTADAKAAAKAVASFRVIATLDHQGAPRYLLLSECGNFAALAHQVGREWLPIAGPYALDTIRACASNVLAGNPRAITWPEAQICLATGAAIFFALAERTTDPPASKGVPGRHPSEPTLPDVPPGAAPASSVATGAVDTGQGREAAQTELFGAPSCESCGG